MKKISLISFTFLIISVVTISCHTSKLRPNYAETKSSKTVKLFNGKNLDGWYTFIQNRGKNIDPKNVFSVDKGLIQISGEEYGCITTNEEFSDYRLVVEFKWGPRTFAPRKEKARDNGILLHSTGADGGYSGIWMYSIECQIIEGGTGDFLVVGDGSDKFSLTSTVAPKKAGGGNVYQPGGTPLTINKGRIDWFGRDENWKDVLGFRGARDVEKPVGEWNRIECVALGDKISIFLNGVLVNEAYNVRPQRGRIQIQSEGAEMFVRRVDLTPITSE